MLAQLCLVTVGFTLGWTADTKAPTNLQEGRIVGGTDALPQQFPYQASLRSKPNLRHFCGGSIVSNRWILTAAHCTIDERASTLVAVVGTHLLSTGGVAHRIAVVRNHEQFNRISLENDIALIQTTHLISFGLFVSAIKLINRDVQSGGGELVVSGWGRIATKGPIPDNLKWLRTKAISWTDCKQLVDANVDTLCAFSKYELECRVFLETVLPRTCRPEPMMARIWL